MKNRSLFDSNGLAAGMVTVFCKLFKPPAIADLHYKVAKKREKHIYIEPHISKRKHGPIEAKGFIRWWRFY